MEETAVPRNTAVSSVCSQFSLDPPQVHLHITWKIKDFVHQTAFLTSDQVESSNLGLELGFDVNFILHCRVVGQHESVAADLVLVCRTAQESQLMDVIQTCVFHILDEDGITCVNQMAMRLKNADNLGFGGYVLGRHVMLKPNICGYDLPTSNCTSRDGTLTLQVRLGIMGSIRTSWTSGNIAASPQRMCLDFIRLYQSQEGADFVLVSNDKHEFPVHRAVLMARSEVFRAMLSHSSLVENTTGRCEIADLDGETVAAVLQFMYSSSTFLMQSIPSKVFYAADKYALLDLKVLCEKRMRENITGRNAARFFIVGDQNSLPVLKDTVKRFVKLHFSEFVKYGGVKELNDYDPVQMMDMLVDVDPEEFNKFLRRSEVVLQFR